MVDFHIRFIRAKQEPDKTQQIVEVSNDYLRGRGFNITCNDQDPLCIRPWVSNTHLSPLDEQRVGNIIIEALRNPEVMQRLQNAKALKNFAETRAFSVALVKADHAQRIAWLDEEPKPEPEPRSRINNKPVNTGGSTSGNCFRFKPD